MHRLLPVVFWSSLLIGCQETSSPQAQKRNSASDNLPNLASALDSTPVAKPTTEYLDLKTISLNGSQPLITKTAALFSVLGKPDSLITTDDYCMPFYNGRFKVAYCKESIVEVYHDTAIVSSLNFRRNPKLVLQTPSIRLSHTTNLAELAKHFPEAVKNQHTINYHKKGKRIGIWLQEGPVPNDYSWLLIFYDGKLESIDHHTTC